MTFFDGEDFDFDYPPDDELLDIEDIISEFPVLVEYTGQGTYIDAESKIKFRRGIPVQVDPHTAERLVILRGGKIFREI